MITNEQLDPLVERCRRDGASMVALFGSASRDEDTIGSDIDLLVQFDQPKSLIAFSRLQRELTELGNRQVDLVTKASLSPYFRDSVLSEMKVLYGAQ